MTIVSEVFYALAKAQAAAKGFSDLAIVKVPHPLGSVSSDIAQSYGKAVAEQVLEALTSKHNFEETSVQDDNQPNTFGISFDEKDPLSFFDSVNDHYYENKLTDGLPIIPPTTERVAQMLEYTNLHSEDSLGVFAPKRSNTTVEKIAINAVMAGCQPEYFPVVLTAVKALLRTEFNLNAIQCTTNPATPLIVVNGPIAKELKINSSSNVFGQGSKANMTIGRAVRLCMLNIGGAQPGTLDRATHGQPGKISFCIAENEDESPWESYSIENGYDKETNTVSVFGVAGTHNILDETSTNAQNLLLMIAGTMTGLGSNNITIGGEVLIVLSPEHAKLISDSNFTKTDIQKFLYDNARIPLGAFPVETKESLLLKRRPKWFTNVPDYYQVSIVDRMEDIKIIVAGSHGPHSVFLPSFGDASRTVIEKIND